MEKSYILPYFSTCIILLKQMYTNYRFVNIQNDVIIINI